MKHFGSVKRIREAGVEEVAKVDGVGLRLAEVICEGVEENVGARHASPVFSVEANVGAGPRARPVFRWQYTMSIEQMSIAPELARALQRFLDFVTLERGLSDNTASAYQRDLSRYLTLLTDLGIDAPDAISQAEVAALLDLLSEMGLEGSSVARNLTSVRMFHQVFDRGGSRAPRSDRACEAAQVGAKVAFGAQYL